MQPYGVVYILVIMVELTRTRLHLHLHLHVHGNDVLFITIYKVEYNKVSV